MAHVRYNQILTHSYTTLGLSCRFSTSGLIFFLLGGGGGGRCQSGSGKEVERSILCLKIVNLAYYFS